MSVILVFTARAEGGRVKVPAFAPRHVRGPVAYSALQLKIELNRAYRANPDLRLAAYLTLLDLPGHVRVLSGGFFVTLEVCLRV